MVYVMGMSIKKQFSRKKERRGDLVPKPGAPAFKKEEGCPFFIFSSSSECIINRQETDTFRGLSDGPRTSGWSEEMKNRTAALPCAAGPLPLEAESGRGLGSISFTQSSPRREKEKSQELFLPPEALAEDFHLPLFFRTLPVFLENPARGPLSGGFSSSESHVSRAEDG